MAYDPLIHGRRSLRLPGYGYSQPGIYYITVCAHQRRCLFGTVARERLRLTPIGEVAREEWLRSCEIRPGLVLDAWVVMPNRVHGLVVVGAHSGAPLPFGLHWPTAIDGGPPTGNGRAHGCAPLRRPARSLGSLVAGYKSAVAKRANALRGTPCAAVRQRMGMRPYRGGRRQEALVAYKEAIRLRPDYEEAHYNAGVAYGNLGRWQEALAAYKEAVRLKPDDADAHYSLGATHVVLANRGAALEEYRILQKLDPGQAAELFERINP